MNLEEKRDRSSAYVKFPTLLNVKSPKLDPNIAEGLDQWPENMSLGVQPTIQELTGAIRSLANGEAVAPDGVCVYLFKISLNGDPSRRQRLLDIVACIWRVKRCRSRENTSSS